MGRMKDQLCEEAVTIGGARRLGSRGLLVICLAPCRHRAHIMIPEHLPDETTLAGVAERLRCDECERRGAVKVAVDWGYTSSRPIDPRS